MKNVSARAGDLTALLALLESACVRELTEAALPAFLRNANKQFGGRQVTAYAKPGGEWYRQGTNRFVTIAPARLRPGVTVNYGRIYITHYLMDGPVSFAFLEKGEKIVGLYLGNFTKNAWLLKG